MLLLVTLLASAYVAASRRHDRGIPARLESARRASELHKRRTGRALKITESAVMNEDMYEEDDGSHFSRLIFRLQMQNAAFEQNIAAHLTCNPISVQETYRSRARPTWAYERPGKVEISTLHMMGLALGEHRDGEENLAVPEESAGRPRSYEGKICSTLPVPKGSNSGDFIAALAAGRSSSIGHHRPVEWSKSGMPLVSTATLEPTVASGMMCPSPRMMFNNLAEGRTQLHHMPSMSFGSDDVDVLSPHQDSSFTHDQLLSGSHSPNASIRLHNSLHSEVGPSQSKDSSCSIGTAYASPAGDIESEQFQYFYNPNQRPMHGAICTFQRSSKNQSMF